MLCRPLSGRTKLCVAGDRDRHRIESNQLDLDEAKFEGIGVDDIVRDTGGARIGRACLEANLPRAGRFLQSQYPAHERHDDIVMRVHVVSGIGSGCKAPLGDDDSAVSDLYQRGRFHNLFGNIIDG
jgi:hypothetical protein